MTDFPSFPEDGEQGVLPEAGTRRIVYVREIRASDLPEEIRARTGGLEQLYAIHGSDGVVLALVADRQQAFIVARQNEMSPVSVH